MITDDIFFLFFRIVYVILSLFSDLRNVLWKYDESINVKRCRFLNIVFLNIDF
jgi:hypothetical protein